MVDHPQSERANVPLVPSTSTSPNDRAKGGQEENFAALHTVIISLITTVGAYVLFQFESKKWSLFGEHGNIMRAAFVILFLYVTAFMAELRLQNQAICFLAIMKQFTPLLGLVVVLLLSIVSVFLGLASSIIWAFLVVGPIMRLFQAIIQWLRGIFQQIRANLVLLGLKIMTSLSEAFFVQNQNLPL